MYMLPSMLGILLLIYFFLYLPERRERQRRELSRKDLKKNDRVVTISGILGTVAGVSPDGNEIVLKIDETTGAKMRVLRSAIHEVLREDAKKEEGKKEDGKKEDGKKDEANAE